MRFFARSTEVWSRESESLLQIPARAFDINARAKRRTRSSVAAFCFRYLRGCPRLRPERFAKFLRQVGPRSLLPVQ